jgi:hypothetical protein
MAADKESVSLPALAGVKPKSIDLAAWRVVESQYITSTRKLVDSDDEQETLERLLDSVKPPVPADPRFRRLHFLLYTSFRHAPLPHGSRFGTRAEGGIWYGSLLLPTAFAEVAYYRLVFLDASAADLGTVTVELSAFQAAIRTRKGIDLTRAPFAAHAGRISSKTSYATSQRLGRDLRARGVEAVIYLSARATGAGKNIALLAPAFARNTPSSLSTWICTATRDRVQISKKDVMRKQRYSFDREQFEVGGRLPTPAL